jgi:hypothetical protein
MPHCAVHVIQAIPTMSQPCPWTGRPVPQPLNDIPAQYGALRGIKIGQVFANLTGIQKAGAHSHVGFHGRAVSSTISGGSKSKIARGVQSLVHYDSEFSTLSEDGESARFCVYSTPRSDNGLRTDALAFALSAAAGAPIQYLISGRQGSSFAPAEPGCALMMG